MAPPTCDPTAEAPKSAQQLGRETGQRGASGCDDQSADDAESKTPKSLRIADLGARVRDNASARESRPAGTRTPDKGIMSPLL